MHARCGRLFFVIFLAFPFFHMAEPDDFSATIPIYVVYSKSHTTLFRNWFKPTLQDENYKIIEIRMEQFCPSGSFMRKGWLKAMQWKVREIADISRKSEGEVFIVSDVDIQFFDKTWDVINQMMRENDFLAQRDSYKGQVCAGFVVCRGGEQTAALWDAVARHMVKTGVHDQRALNHVLMRTELGKSLRWSFLPNTFMGAGTNRKEGMHLWLPGQDIAITPGILMHHANCTTGIENKVRQLQYVRAAVKTIS